MSVPGLREGLVIDKYVLGSLLGRGGFGAVYRARDRDLGRDVAIKFLLPEHTSRQEILQRFLQEARAAAKIGHPGIVTVYEAGRVEGTGTEADASAFIVMELLVGETLTARLSRAERLLFTEASVIGREIASALGAAHDAGIIHRDLKPDNVFLMRDVALDRGERVKVLDFGIAKLADTEATSVQTQSLMVFGTPRYMSPEQCRSSARIDHRSDIYSLGCILFELVTGRPPFVGETGELIAMHQMVAPPLLRTVVPGAPDAYADLVMQMLDKDPARRPASMAAVEAGLRGHAASASVELTAIPSGVAPTLAPDAPEPTALPATPVALLAGRAPIAVAPTPISRIRPRRARWMAAVLVAIALAVGAFALWPRARSRGAPLASADAVALLGALTVAPRSPPVPPPPVDRLTIGSIPTELGAPDAAVAPVAVAIVGRGLSIADKQAMDDTSLAVSAVAAAIATRYLAGLERCERGVALASLVLMFTVNETGRVVSPHAHRHAGKDTATDACVEGLMIGWRFPIPKDRDGVASEAGFSLTFHPAP